MSYKYVSMESHVYAKADLKYYDKSCSILSLDRYMKDKGEDEFSRKIVWFYVYGDDEIEEELTSRVKSLIQERFLDDSVDWDLMTLYPTHYKGEVNSNMSRLLENISSELNIDYEQKLHRTKTVKENHELNDIKAKSVNLEGSIEVEDDVEGRNVIIIDNIALSGSSILHGANKLLDKGAEKVYALTLGIGESFPNQKKVRKNEKASELVDEDEGG